MGLGIGQWEGTEQMRGDSGTQLRPWAEGWGVEGGVARWEEIEGRWCADSDCRVDRTAVLGATKPCPF